MTNRGEVWLARVDKFRPVVIVHRQAAAPRIGSVLVAPVTSTERLYQSQVELGPEHGIGRVSWANLDAVQPLDRSLLIRRLGALDGPALRRLCDAVRFTFGC